MGYQKLLYRHFVGHDDSDGSQIIAYSQSLSLQYEQHYSAVNQKFLRKSASVIAKSILTKLEQMKNPIGRAHRHLAMVLFTLRFLG